MMMNTFRHLYYEVRGQRFTCSWQGFSALLKDTSAGSGCVFEPPAYLITPTPPSPSSLKDLLHHCFKHFFFFFLFFLKKALDC